jgi:hypothetical protein
LQHEVRHIYYTREYFANLCKVLERVMLLAQIRGTAMAIETRDTFAGSFLPNRQSHD